MPELITPRNSVCLNMPLKRQDTRMTATSASKPAAASVTRPNAVGTAPSAGTATRMKRKLPPQIAARTNRRNRSMGRMMAM